MKEIIFQIGLINSNWVRLVMNLGKFQIIERESNRKDRKISRALHNHF